MRKTFHTNPHVFKVVKEAPVPKIVGRGRKHGHGKNLDMLNKMDKGDSIWEVPRKKMASIKWSAWRYGIKIRIRRLPNSPNYAIFKLE